MVKVTGQYRTVQAMGGGQHGGVESVQCSTVRPTLRWECRTWSGDLCAISGNIFKSDGDAGLHLKSDDVLCFSDQL